MSKKVSRVKAIVEDCLKKLVNQYEEQEEDFLTEGDVASSLFCMLRHEMENQGVDGFKVHVGLRPYKDKDPKLVLKAKDTDSEKWEWKEHHPKNSGAVVDVVVIDEKKEYFNKACEDEKIESKKFWRLVNYPLEAFVVCIEVKIKVSGNKKRIEKDVNELLAIKGSTNGKCLVYLLVVDRKASIERIKEIEKLCVENGVILKAFPPV